MIVYGRMLARANYQGTGDGRQREVAVNLIGVIAA
jgi:hypothetical protein